MKEIIKRYHDIKILKDSLSEVDIQVLLIEPILCHKGWDLLNPNEIKRAGRSSKSKEFDIEAFDLASGLLKIAIECKSLKSDEFNINNISNGIGALKFNKEKKAYCQKKQKDGVAQLRRYCVRSEYFRNSCPPIPILTNGYEWVIFNTNFYNDNSKFESDIDCSYILAHETIESEKFHTQILDKLKK
jgi:predicted type IV restriction endonuclease